MSLRQLPVALPLTRFSHSVTIFVMKCATMEPLSLIPTLHLNLCFVVVTVQYLAVEAMWQYVAVPGAGLWKCPVYSNNCTLRFLRPWLFLFSSTWLLHRRRQLSMPL